MKQQIENILQGLPSVTVNQTGNLWQISIADLTGVSEDGIFLAHNLKAQHENRKVFGRYRFGDFFNKRHESEPKDIAISAFLNEPEPIEAVTPETIPPALSDLIRENEAYGEAQARLWALYVGLQNKLMLGLASEADARLHTRLHGHLAWISKGAIEVTRD